MARTRHLPRSRAFILARGSRAVATPSFHVESLSRARLGLTRPERLSLLLPPPPPWVKGRSLLSGSLSSGTGHQHNPTSMRSADRTAAGLLRHHLMLGNTL